MENLRQIVEAIIFLSEEPVTIKKIKETTGAGTGEIKACIESIEAEYRKTERGIQVREVAGGYKFFTHPACAPWLEKFIASTEFKKLTQAALETLAIIAYRQPLTRLEISNIRGVNSESVMNSLLEKGLIREAGKKEAPGSPFLYATTEYFLESFGLKRLSDLPPLEQFIPDEKEFVEEDE